MIQINEFSKKTGFSKRMLRYLEEMNLIVPERSDSDYRKYSTQDLHQAKKISFLRSLGFSYEEIKQILNENLETFLDKLTKLKETKEKEIQAEYCKLDKIIQTTKELTSAKLSGSEPPLNALKNILAPSEREKILQDFNFQERIITAKFPEFEIFAQNLVNNNSSLFCGAQIASLDFYKFGELAKILPPGELAVYKIEPFYTNYTIYAPEEIRIEKEWTEETFKNEAVIFKNTWEKQFLKIQTELLARTNKTTAFHDLYNYHDVCLSFDFRIFIGEKSFSVYLILPYHIIHTVKNIGLSNEVSRNISQTIKSLSREELSRKTCEIPNKDYIATVVLVDAEARIKLLSIVSDKAKNLVLEDLSNYKELYEKYWSKK